MLASQCPEVRVPGRQTIIHCGIRMQMVPGFWLRRWTRFPRYYESHNPSMLLRMQRVPPDDDYQGWAERESRFLMETAHNIQADESFTMPTLTSGEKDSMLIRGLYCPQPGNVVLT